MRIVRTVEALRREIAAARRPGGRVGFVPTGGALHEGHLSLILDSLAQCDLTVAGIVPRPGGEPCPASLERDAALCRDGGADILFVPEPWIAAPEPSGAFVDPGPAAAALGSAEAARASATLTVRLLNMVQPDVAFFGAKDPCRCALLRRLVRDLGMPVEIAVAPVLREPDGLAVSRTNRSLSRDERRRAACLHRGLRAAEAAYARGERRSVALLAAAALPLTLACRVETLELRDARTLDLVRAVLDGPAALCVAAWFGDTRLTDGLVLGEPEEGRWRYSLSA